ncbi:MAG: class I SAM-dependent methyltransferase [Methanomicrobiales archaeon]
MAGEMEPVPGWGVAVPKAQGESHRRRLREQGVLDPTLRPRVEGDTLLLPVREPVPGAREYLFVPFDPRGPPLPRHELIGGIAVMQEPDAGEAERLLHSRPSIHTVLCAESEVEGEFRTRRYRVLAGDPTTATRYREHGLVLDIDLAVAYFSPRLATERQRLASRVRPGERVLDMFAGVGPCALSLGRRGAWVAAADLNPSAVHLMVHNCRLNRIRSVTPFFADARHLRGIGLPLFDRVVMNLPLGFRSFLDDAWALCRPGGTIHVYALQEEAGQFTPLLEAHGAERVEEREVRTYSPGRWHAVYDVVRSTGSNLVP